MLNGDGILSPVPVRMLGQPVPNGFPQPRLQPPSQVKRWQQKVFGWGNNTLSESNPSQGRARIDADAGGHLHRLELQ